MKKFVAFLLIGAIAFIALHDYYVAQFDTHEVKQELHCDHLHHGDYHLHALVPEYCLFKDEIHENLPVNVQPFPQQPSMRINPPPPKV